MRVYLVAFAFIFTAASAHQTHAPNTFECKYDGKQQEMNVCAVRDYAAADFALNKTYKALISTLSTAGQVKLRNEQRAWLAHRDPDCKAEFKSSEGGSIWPLEYFGCLKSSTELRTKELVMRVHK